MENAQYLLVQGTHCIACLKSDHLVKLCNVRVFVFLLKMNIYIENLIQENKLVSAPHMWVTFKDSFLFFYKVKLLCRALPIILKIEYQNVNKVKVIFSYSINKGFE